MTITEQAYQFAEVQARQSLDLGSWDELSDRELGEFRDELFSDLLTEFEDIEGPELSSIMDEALSGYGFPHYRA